MKKTLLVVVILAVSLGLMAHEFWLEPTRFRYKKGEAVIVRFRVGENFTGENWTGDHDKVKALHLFQNNQSSDISSLLGNAKGDSLVLTSLSEGTAMVVFNSVNSYIELDAAKFNAYLREDGLTYIYNYRKSQQQADSPGHEFYQRSVKTLIQVGGKQTNDYANTTSLPLDIIPLSNPYAVRDSAKVAFRILFRDKPLDNHLCKIWNSSQGAVQMQEIRSDKKGIITMVVSARGSWMLSTVYMTPSEQKGAQWQSFWGSLTWGYQ